jgi:hypothetical protein
VGYPIFTSLKNGGPRLVIMNETNFEGLMLHYSGFERGLLKATDFTKLRLKRKRKTS